MKTTQQIEHLLSQGKKPKELIEMVFSKAIVTKVRRQLKKIKTGSQEKVQSRSRAKLQLTEKAPAARHKTSAGEPHIQEGGSRVVILHEMETMLAIAEKFGVERRQSCPYLQEGICILQAWTIESEIPQGIGEPIPPKSEGGDWHIRPSSFCCVMCTLPLEGRLEEVEFGLTGNPMSGAKYQFVCEGCGSKGWIATLIKCTKCGWETRWGWWPNKE
jgi:hypothetical protein